MLTKLKIKRLHSKKSRKLFHSIWLYNQISPLTAPAMADRWWLALAAHTHCPVSLLSTTPSSPWRVSVTVRRRRRAQWRLAIRFRTAVVPAVFPVPSLPPPIVGFSPPSAFDQLSPFSPPRSPLQLQSMASTDRSAPAEDQQQPQRPSLFSPYQMPHFRLAHRWALPRARPLIPRSWDRFGLARPPPGYSCVSCVRAQGGAGADDQVPGARCAPGPRARGVLRAAVHGRRLAHLRGHHHLARRPWVIIFALVCHCFRPPIHVSGDPCWGLRLLCHAARCHTLDSGVWSSLWMSPSCEACAQPWAERCALDLVETWSSWPASGGWGQLATACQLSVVIWWKS
jgi:hypothetical protein